MSSTMATKEEAAEALGAIRKALRALYKAHKMCEVSIPIPTSTGEPVIVASSRDLANLPQETILVMDGCVYIKWWHHWKGRYNSLSHDDMWFGLLAAYADEGLDGCALLTPREAICS